MIFDLLYDIFSCCYTVIDSSAVSILYCILIACMQDSFARARTRPSARATIGYLVYKLIAGSSDYSSL